MNSRLEELARRVEDDPAFLASVLAVYARSENMDDEALARALGCPLDRLPALRLCLRPRPEPSHFQRDVQEIATHFGLDPDALARAVRRADAIIRLRGDRHTARGALMAARDRDEPPPPPTP
ncbi:MAG: hypothetical protein IRZ14_06320 [Chloroflexi bacterium]|nr:hypothetical protein [Chloroflexota bacterium]